MHKQSWRRSLPEMEGWNAESDAAQLLRLGVTEDLHYQSS